MPPRPFSNLRSPRTLTAVALAALLAGCASGPAAVTSISPP